MVSRIYLKSNPTHQIEELIVGKKFVFNQFEDI